MIRWYRRDRAGRFTGGHRAVSWQLEEIDEIRWVNDQARRVLRDLIVIAVAAALIFFFA